MNTKFCEPINSLISLPNRESRISHHKRRKRFSRSRSRERDRESLRNKKRRRKNITKEDLIRATNKDKTLRTRNKKMFGFLQRHLLSNNNNNRDKNVNNKKQKVKEEEDVKEEKKMDVKSIKKYINCLKEYKNKQIIISNLKECKNNLLSCGYIVTGIKNENNFNSILSDNFITWMPVERNEQINQLITKSKLKIDLIYKKKLSQIDNTNELITDINIARNALPKYVLHAIKQFNDINDINQFNNIMDKLNKFIDQYDRNDDNRVLNNNVKQTPFTDFVQQ